MNKLPLRRVAEVAFLASNAMECREFYRKIGLDISVKPERINFANVGEQLYGVCDSKQGFIDGSGGFVKAMLHVAFEVPGEKLDDCISFLDSKGIKASPKNKFTNWHGVPHSTSVYFPDPAGNIIELWAPSREARLDRS